MNDGPIGVFLVVLLVCPVANAFLNIASAAAMSFVLGLERDFARSLGGFSLELLYRPLWIRAALAMSRLVYWAGAASLPGAMKRAAVFYAPGWLRVGG